MIQVSITTVFMMKSESRFCRDCRHKEVGLLTFHNHVGWFCGLEDRLFDNVTGDRTGTPCDIARREGMDCGPSGNHFELIVS